MMQELDSMQLECTPEKKKKKQGMRENYIRDIKRQFLLKLTVPKAFPQNNSGVSTSSVVNEGAFILILGVWLHAFLLPRFLHGPRWSGDERGFARCAGKRFPALLPGCCPVPPLPGRSYQVLVSRPSQAIQMSWIGLDARWLSTRSAVFRASSLYPCLSAVPL